MTTQKPRSRFLPIALIAVGSLCFLCIVGFVCSSLMSTPTTSTPFITQSGDQQPAPNNQPSTTNTPRPTSAPPTSSPGESRAFPLPPDAIMGIGDDQELSILGVTRPANSIVAEGNMFNSTPEPGIEYLILNLRITCTKPSSDKCTFDQSSLHMVGTDGAVRDVEFVAGIPGEFEFYAEFFGGSSIEGNLVYLVPAGDSNVILYYEPLLFGEPTYISLPAP